MDGLDKSLPLAEGMVDAEQSAKVNASSDKRYCLNCNTELSDVYCPHCGQKDIPKRQTLGELFTNFISSFWSYESKFFKTCRFLLFKPGFLATEYTAGRRERYFHPARMYVFISFVFFLLYFSLPEGRNDDTGNNVSNNDQKSLRDDLKVTGQDTIYTIPNASLIDSMKTNSFIDKYVKNENKKGFRLANAKYSTVAAYDSAELAKPEKDRDGWLARKVTIRAIQLNEKYDGNMEQFARDFRQSFMDNFSKVLFYLLPFFALLLKLLYIRRDFYYSEHLVLSIYYYNFFFLAASILLLIDLIPGLEFVSTIIEFWIYFYFLFAMKQMYRQSWRKTTVKFVIFSFMFMLLVVIGVSINAMVTLMVI